LPRFASTLLVTMTICQWSLEVPVTKFCFGLILVAYSVRKAFSNICSKTLPPVWHNCCHWLAVLPQDSGSTIASFCPYPVAILGPGQGATAPQFHGHPWFFAKITQMSDFFAFPNFRKLDKFVAVVKCPKTKSASVLRVLCPLTPLLGGLPLDPTGGSAPDSHYRLVLLHLPWGCTPRFCGLELPLPISPAYFGMFHEK